MAHERMVMIGPEHPALPGHFPGHPVVPGVVMLGEVIEAVRQTADKAIMFVGLPSIKFVSPWSPGEELSIRVEEQDQGTATFTCQVGARVIASGCLEYRLDEGDSTGAA